MARVVDRLQLSQLVAGYLWAANCFTAGCVTEAIEIAGLLGWIDNYCQDNPADFVITPVAHSVRFHGEPPIKPPISISS